MFENLFSTYKRPGSNPPPPGNRPPPPPAPPARRFAAPVIVVHHTCGTHCIDKVCDRNDCPLGE